MASGLNLSIASFTNTAGNSPNLIFSGAGNATVGAIATVTGIASSGRNVNVFFSGTGTETLTGTNNFTGKNNQAQYFAVNGGTVVLASSGALSGLTGDNSGNFTTLGNLTASSTNAANLLIGAAGSTGGLTTPATVNNGAGGFGLQPTTTGQLTVGGQNTSGVNTFANLFTLGTQSGTTPNFSATGKGVNLVAATGGETDFTGVIADPAIGGTGTRTGLGAVTVNNPYVVNGATVTPTGNVKLGAVNTFAGATTVNGGTLTLGITKALGATSGITVASGAMLSVVANSALNTPVTATGTLNNPVAVSGEVAVTLNGGTLLRNNTGVSLVSLGSGTTVGVGALTLTSTASTIDYGTTGVGTLNFASLSTLSASNTLTVVDFYTTHPSASGTDNTDDRLIFNQDETANLSFITIDGVTPTQVALSNGEFELVVAVPEPSTWVAGLLGLGVLGFRLRRRVAGMFARRGASV